MLYHLSTMSGGKLPCHFLYTWLIYHEILGAFTQPLQTTQQGMSSIDFLTDDNVDKTLVRSSQLVKTNPLTIYLDNRISRVFIRSPRSNPPPE